ncbi:MAG: polysaccharide export protein [Nevskia sp.]|nr:polysaccharide export protein [Nevskia sp.]
MHARLPFADTGTIMTVIIRLACAAALFLLAGCYAEHPPVTAPTAAPATVADATAAKSDIYVIGPGDQLNIFVYDSPQLSMTVPVRPDGRISTPLVPELMAAGKTPSQLASDITERLKEFVKDPNVTVIVSGFIGPLDRQIRVIGEAVEPQAVPYRDHMTVLDLMIMTKGLTRYAAGNRAVIARRVGGKQETIHVRLDDLLKDGDIDQNVEMQPGDTLIVPQSWF